ncbi:MAG: DUF211 domain-containing protein [Archaeoglobales archaeon]|jgi:hypothetical protein|nr:DUF211 domain-containing protein [Archaeoglobi archaeon]NHW23330.1 DUF211 domain-containing protein [Archaeoglobales archaeon]TDA25618.1 MAG: hypothetical protein DSO01_07210 [Archaeoglobi archaeon]TDA26058.1 MAG: hypothetical protein DSN99_07055 [Archaeoglobi archaeon]TDA28709.1 MAG: hypothetical protein DSO00_05550 [Archaeoglobi archaeon]
MGGLRRVVLDVLKSHEPSNVFFAMKLSQLENVEGVNITLSEIDQETESVKITIVGTDMDYDEIRRVIEDLGGVVHSIDEVVAGKKIVESVRTEQD